ncbi:MAG: hypothetical protein KIH63_000730 [Candidatus Saccharibacteria bacterium]|nr:hypothetical protein [Candidatus Saccharibacteria bacterium]
MTGPLHIDSNGRIFEQFPVSDITGGETIRIGHMMPVAPELADQFPYGRPLVAEVDRVVAEQPVPVITLNKMLGIDAILLQSGSYVPIDPSLVVYRERQV